MSFGLISGCNLEVKHRLGFQQEPVWGGSQLAGAGQVAEGAITQSRGISDN